MKFLRNLIGKKQSADNQPDRTKVPDDQCTDGPDKPLRCLRCGATLQEKTPNFAVVRCGECGVMFKVAYYRGVNM